MASQECRVRVAFGWGDVVLYSEERYTHERARAVAEAVADCVGPEACVEIVEHLTHEAVSGRRPPHARDQDR